MRFRANCSDSGPGNRLLHNVAIGGGKRKLLSHRVDDVRRSGEAPLEDRLETIAERLDPIDGAVGEVAVGRREARSRLVVPAGEDAAGQRSVDFAATCVDRAGAWVDVCRGEVAGDRVSVEARVWDLKSRKLILGRRYSGGASYVDRIAHTLANDLVKYFTGKQGAFLSRFVLDRSVKATAYKGIDSSRGPGGGGGMGGVPEGLDLAEHLFIVHL